MPNWHNVPGHRPLLAKIMAEFDLKYCRRRSCHIREVLALETHDTYLLSEERGIQKEIKEIVFIATTIAVA